MPRLPAMTVKRDWQGGCIYCGASTCQCSFGRGKPIYDPELIPGFREADDSEGASPYVCEVCRARCDRVYRITTDTEDLEIWESLVCPGCYAKVMEVLKLA